MEAAARRQGGAGHRRDARHRPRDRRDACAQRRRRPAAHRPRRGRAAMRWQRSLRSWARQPTSSPPISPTRRRPRGWSPACLDRFGRIDALVNAAGLTDRASFLDAGLDDWAWLFAVNARAPFFLMQARDRRRCARAARAARSSTSCRSTPIAARPTSPSIRPPRRALAALTKNAANAHRFDRIRVNGINVGWTDTPAERVMQAETLGHGPGWIDAANASPAVRPPAVAARTSRTSPSSCSATPPGR